MLLWQYFCVCLGDSAASWKCNSPPVSFSVSWPGCKKKTTKEGLGLSSFSSVFERVVAQVSCYLSTARSLLLTVVEECLEFSRH